MSQPSLFWWQKYGTLAQMVWPSIWVVTSISMSISRFCARPSAMRVKTRHIQPMPSRQGVHWPQLSCL